MEGKCNLCHQPAILMCQRCRDSYCSQYCQTRDWPKHKVYCMPMPPLVPIIQKLTIKTQSSQCITEDVQKEIIPQNKESGYSNVRGVKKVLFATRQLNNPFVSSNSTVNKEGASNYEIEKRNVFYNPASNEKYPGMLMDYVDKTSTKNKSVLQKSYRKNEIPTVSKTENNTSYLNMKSATDNLIKPYIDTKITPLTSSEIKVTTTKIINLFQKINDHSTSSNEIKPITNSFPKLTVPPLKQDVTTTTSQVKTLSEKSITPTSNWKTPFPIDSDNYIDVVVQYISEDNPTILWVMRQDMEKECNKLLGEINKNISIDAPRCSHNEIKINNMYAVMFEDVYYRGVVIDDVNALNEVLVRLVDYGNEFYAKVEEIKRPIPLMNNLKAFAFKITLNEHRQVSIGDNLKIMVLKLDDNVHCVEERIESNAGIKKSIKEYFTIIDIPTVAIPEEVYTKLFCLDTSFIKNGYITACIYNVNKIRHMEHLTNKIGDYCKTLPNERYSPANGEICLTIFDEDKIWYRAVCIEKTSETFFKLKFIDYGNIINTTSIHIRKMTEEFLYPTLANFCKIADIYNASPAVVSKLKLFMRPNQVFEIDSAKKQDQYYILNIATFKP